MSTTGVPSIASKGPTASSRPSIPCTVTSWRPSGFGRSDERVANTRQRPRLVVTRVHLENRPIRLVQPRHENEPIADADPLKRARDGRLQDDPRVGCSLAALTGRVLPPQEGRADDADRLQHVAVVRHGSR